MVPNIDMNAIVSSAVFQPDSWSAFSFYESIYVLGSAGGTLSVILTLCLVGGRRLRQSSCSASVQGILLSVFQENRTEGDSPALRLFVLL